MKVTEKDVDYVAELAHLQLAPAERSAMLRDLNSILSYIDQLNQLDTSGVEPMAQVAAGHAPALREDAVQPGLSRQEALRAAPESDGTCFKVPKVIER